MLGRERLALVGAAAERPEKPAIIGGEPIEALGVHLGDATRTDESHAVPIRSHIPTSSGSVVLDRHNTPESAALAAPTRLAHAK